ncbi:PREDICTED: uncharacterized protein C6orf203-like [Priapulus caudatus]|uniref:Uncharacterized protein C6orf203-like n=1 Tax=Priapulus caudatus TaxID=37621 RepID=A0ABM1DRC6_PRICU|nr:PREDICTED: uncharacterized protein C6orf203-like [Priapulus caudatus]
MAAPIRAITFRCPRVFGCYTQEWAVCAWHGIVSVTMKRHISALPSLFLPAWYKNSVIPGPEIEHRHMLTLNQSVQPVLTQLRCLSHKNKGKKKGKHKSNVEEEHSDEDNVEMGLVDDDNDNDLDGLPKDFKDMVVTVSSLRLDAVLKTGLGISRSATEDAFYGSKLRINRQRVLKKSCQVALGDEIDIVLGPRVDNENMLDVQRVLVRGISNERTRSDRIILALRRWKKFTVENYLLHEKKFGSARQNDDE